MTILRTCELSVGYGEKTVVSGINLEVFKGQVVCLLGPNGSGKTTILRTLCGLLAPVAGVTYLNEANLTSYAKLDLAKQVAVVLTEHVAPEFLKVQDLVGAARYPHTGFMGNLTVTDTAAVTKALNLVSAGHLADRYFLELSDGEQQKVLLARALAQETEVIVLDEPTSFLDLKNRIELIVILTRLSKEGLTVILSLHELDVALKCCDTVILVKDGAVLSWGPPEITITEQSIQSLYQLEDANFNILTGSTELINHLPTEIFVVAGNGAGIPVYRALTRAGYGFITGILHSNDLDYQVSQSMGVTIIGSTAFETINDQTYLAALEILAKVTIVIDTGFLTGSTNHKNLELIRAALNLHKQVITLRKDFREHFTSEDCSKIIPVNDLAELLTQLRLLLFR